MILCLLVTAALSRQSLRLPPLFSDNMVLQRGISAPFFGTSSPRQAVTVAIAGQSQTVKAGDDGTWALKMQPMQAGGPYNVTVASAGSTVTIKNVMIGEVWVCSGQSNMERQESMAGDYAQAMDEADPAIRMFTVEKNSTESPALLARGLWVPADKTTVGAFSAVALSFGRELHNRLHVPVGLIASAWGGTRVAAWTSREAIAANPVLKPSLDAYLAEIVDFQAKEETYRSDLKAWIATRSDKENEGYLKGWAQPHLYETDWKPKTLPGTMGSAESEGEGQPFEGAVWFRRTFELPQGWAGNALKLELGPISGYDETYVNGAKVGYTKEQPSDPSLASRTYRISPGIPVEGTNTIAIRVFAPQGVCGFTGFPDQMRLSVMDGDPPGSIPLAGEWMEKVESKVDTAETPPHMPLGPGSPEAPGGLFNGMIAPLTNYGIKGVIWYQGESDADHPSRYKLEFATLIHDWRQKWGQPNLPFYFVQLANYKPRLDYPADSDWAQLRESQAYALKLPHTGMATAIDIGDADTIHPLNKREVGRRLSLVALSKDYGVHVAFSGPMFQHTLVAGGSLRVFFTHAENGLKTSDGRPPVGFAVAGADHVFHWATAAIQGTAVLVSNPKVPSPVYVRYAWADNPDCNLINTEGLPAIPFRTDP